MLNKDQLIEIAKFSGLRPHQQEKNYLQTVLLKSIYSKYDLIFKGGTSLMMVYGLNRFSEDLDFTLLRPINPAKLQLDLSKDLTLLGLQFRIEKHQETELGFSFRIGIQGPLFRKELDRCYIYVEVSNREKHFLPPLLHGFQPIYPDLLPFAGNILNKNEILAEKFRALCTRKKARDVYDIWFLINHDTQTSLDLINQKMAFYHQEFSISSIPERLAQFKTLWKTELQSFIIGPLPEFSGVRDQILNYIQKL